MMPIQKTLAAIVAAAGFMVTTNAQAAIVINFTQVGTTLTVDAAGTINLTGATMTNHSTSTGGAIGGSAGLVRVGSGGLDYYIAAGPSSFGLPASTGLASTSLGSAIGTLGQSHRIALPTGYVSNSFISGTSTFTNFSMASYGLLQGSYVYSLPNDTITVNIRPFAAAVPEPATWGMMIAGFGAIGLAIRARRRKLQTASA